MKPIVVPMNIAELEKTIPVNVSENQREIPFLSDTDVRPMPEISIGDVETLPTGSEAEAWMTGNSMHPVLNLGIPQGIQGETGAPGKDGKDGSDYVLTQADRTEIAGIVETDIAPTLAGKQDALSVELEISGTKIPVTGFQEFTVSGIHGMRLLAGTGAEWFFADADGLNTVYNSLSNAISGKQDSGDYAASAAGDTTHTALKAAGIMYGEVDTTSTSTAYTATIPGITSYYDGLTVMLRNGVVTSAASFTIDINGLGAVGSYSNMATGNDITPTAPTRDSTIFNINYTMLFVYSSTVVSGGCWICYRGYNSDTNTISYQIRTNSTTLPTVSRTRYYRILFTSADSTQWVPANTQYDNSNTSTKTVNQTPINPHGRIVYMSGTTNVAAGSNVSATVVWDQYALALGYSFNRTGSELKLTTKKPVYVKCAPQADGSAIMDSTEPIVQDLPTTADGKIYIYLGIAYSATNIELTLNNPVYHYYNGAIRLWTGPV